MGSTRAGRAVGPLLALVLVLCSSSSRPLTAAPIGFSGTVHDSLGHGLEGVEVLVLAWSTSSPVAVLRSDREGRFGTGELGAGSYRVAAFKEGYLASIGSVDTWIGQSIDLVLHPMPQPEGTRAAPLPRDASWMLRLPRRSILRVQQPTPPAADGELEASDDGFAEPMRLQLDQLFSVSLEPVDTQVRGGELEATETRMMLSSSMGDRGRILFHGRHEDLGSSSRSGESTSSAGQQAQALSVDMSHQTGADSRLAVAAFYGQKDYELSTESMDPVALESVRHAQRTWGYDASWSLGLADVGRMEVELDFQDTLLTAPHTDSGSGAGDGFANRALTAEGSFQRSSSARHQTEVALRAGHQWWSTAQLPSAEPSAGQDLGGWSVQLEAQDSWAVSGPLTLVYGLGYKQALLARDAALIVPRLGGSWSFDGGTVRAAASYHAVVDRSSQLDAPPESIPFRPRGTLGYEAEVEWPFASGLSLKGGTSYSPWQFRALGYGDGTLAADPLPLYMTDGNASLRENHVVLVAQRSATRAYLELHGGRVQGTVAPLLPFDAMVGLAPETGLHYLNARCGVDMRGYGTDIVLDYFKVGARAAGGDPGRSLQESIELRMQQELRGLQTRVDLRFLAALRVGMVEADSVNEWLQQGGDPAPLEALNRRLTAGLSVSF